MEISKLLMVLVLSVVSFLALLALTKLMGNRQTNQLTMLDYVIGISIGSIAAEMASHPEDESWLGLLAMAVFAVLAVLMNILNTKSLHIRKKLIGMPTVLYERGTLYYNNLKKTKLDLTELLMECRISGYFDLSQLELIIMEINGELSFLPAEGERPLTPKDMSLAPKQARPSIPIIMDGALLPTQLKTSGNDENWLKKQMELQGFSDIRDILLAVVDDTNMLSIYEKNEDKDARRYFR